MTSTVRSWRSACAAHLSFCYLILLSPATVQTDVFQFKIAKPPKQKKEKRRLYPLIKQLLNHTREKVCHTLQRCAVCALRSRELQPAIIEARKDVDATYSMGVRDMRAVRVRVLKVDPNQMFEVQIPRAPIEVCRAAFLRLFACCV